MGHWVGRGWSDGEILLQAAPLTLAGYKVEQTRAELATMIAGARQKWNKPDLKHTVEPEPDSDGALVLVEPARFEGMLVPERRWLVRDWIPFGYVTALYGDGGTGKILLAQMLATATAIRQPWLDLETAGCGAAAIRSLAVLCEDDLDELHRRQENINRLYGCRFGELEQVRWLPRLGYDNLLMTFDRNGRGVLTPFFEQVRQAALEFQAQLLIVDTAADTFGGNEIIRSQVRQFIQAALGRLARELNGAVLLCAHPSVAGLTSGTGTGGSTGWSNTVRSRLYLERPKPDSDEEESAAPDDSRRILTRKKANMASTGDSVELRWENGVFVTVGARINSFTAGSLSAGWSVPAPSECSCSFSIASWPRAGTSPTRRAVPTTPRKVFAKRPEREGLRRGDFAAAMERLFASGAIRVATFKDGERHWRKRIETIADSAGSHVAYAIVMLIYTLRKLFVTH